MPAGEKRCSIPQLSVWVTVTVAESLSASTVVTSVFSFFFLKRSETLFTSSGTRLTIWLLESGLETSGSTRTSFWVKAWKK